MNFIEYDSITLKEFYKKNGLDFIDHMDYFGTNVHSYVLKDGEKIIGALSISKYKNKSFIESIAVIDEYRNKGIGIILLNKALSELERPIYVVSKIDEFYIKNGFIYTEANLIDDNCRHCSSYNVTCFPRVLVYK